MQLLLSVTKDTRRKAAREREKENTMECQFPVLKKEKLEKIVFLFLISSALAVKANSSFLMMTTPCFHPCNSGQVLFLFIVPIHIYNLIFIVAIAVTPLTHSTAILFPCIRILHSTKGKCEILIFLAFQRFAKNSSANNEIKGEKIMPGKNLVLKFPRQPCGFPLELMKKVIKKAREY